MVHVSVAQDVLFDLYIVFPSKTRKAMCQYNLVGV